MENNEIALRKIPLKIFIEILQDAWDRGADYVDIIGVPDAIQDNISIAIKEEYMSHQDDDDDKEISDEDLNQLI
jgi:hypothetical protein